MLQHVLDYVEHHCQVDLIVSRETGQREQWFDHSCYDLVKTHTAFCNPMLQ